MKPTILTDLKCIGVIADTHGKFPAVAEQLLKEAQIILHAGDICNVEMLQRIQKIAPTMAVRGNNDFFPGIHENELLHLNGVTFHINHYPINLSRIQPKTDWYIFGHTHVPYDEISGSTRLYNPGSVGKANKGAPPSFAIFHWQENTWKPELHILK